MEIRMKLLQNNLEKTEDEKLILKRLLDKEKVILKINLFYQKFIFRDWF